MFQPDHATIFAPAAGVAALGVMGVGLSQLERTVVSLARREADQGRWRAEVSRSALGRRIAAALRLMTGRRAMAGLADEKLEALRRFVALVRRHDRHADRAAELLRDHGYGVEQLAAIEAMALA